MGLDAASLSNIYLASQSVNAAAGVANTYQQVQAERAQGRYAKQTAYDNAAMMELQAKDVDAAGDRAAAMRGLETRDLMGKQVTAAAGQGIDVSGGGTLDQILAETQGFGRLDAEMERNNAWRTAFGLRSDATNTRMAGKNAKASAVGRARMTAASGGLQFGRDALKTAYEYGQFRETPQKYTKPPAGKNMSDPRNR